MSPLPKWPTVYCVGWGIKLYSLTHSLQRLSETAIWQVRLFQTRRPAALKVPSLKVTLLILSPVAGLRLAIHSLHDSTRDVRFLLRSSGYGGRLTFMSSESQPANAQKTALNTQRNLTYRCDSPTVERWTCMSLHLWNAEHALSSVRRTLDSVHSHSIAHQQITTVIRALTLDDVTERDVIGGRGQQHARHQLTRLTRQFWHNVTHESTCYISK